MRKTLLFLGMCLLFMGTGYGQTQIIIEDFEDGTVGYTVSTAEFTDGSGDYFTRTDGSNISGTYSSPQGTSFFAAMDIDGEGASSEQTMTFDDINISGYTSLELRIYLAEDDDGTNQDWDSSDLFTIEYDIDNSGSFSDLLHVRGTGSSNSEPAIDTDFDGTGDGTIITSTFSQFTQSISGTGSTLDLKLTFNFNSGDEDIAIDNIEIYGTSTGGSATKLAITDVNGGDDPVVGESFSVNIQSQDGSDLPANLSQDSTVTLSVINGTGSLSGSLSGTINSGGNLVTLSGLSYDTAESFNLIVTNTGGGLSADTVSVTVIAAADQLVIKDFPSSGFSNTVVSSFTVEAQRSSDNSVDDTYTKNITISKVSGSGTIGGTVTKTAVNGIATFDDITFDTDGSYTISAGDGSLTSSSSSSLSITTAVTPSQGSVFITEVADATTYQNEFIELYNIGSTSVTLDGSDLLMYDATGTTLQTTFDLEAFTGSTIIPAGGYLIISRGNNESSFESEFGTLNGSTNFLQGTTVAYFGTGRRWVLKYSGTVIDSTSAGVGNDRDYQFPLGSQTFITGIQGEATPGELDGSIDLTGSTGYRLLSAPTTATISSLLDPIWTQGASTGADATNGDPNVFTWPTTAIDGTSSNWSGMTDLSGTLGAGTGILVYVFADDDYNGSDDAFPKTLSVSGTENTADVAPTVNSNANGWTLVGNPFASTIDFDVATKSELTDVAYVWDANASSWKDWNGTSGDLTDGLITPFQGFFIQNSGTVTSPSITFTSGSKATGGSFYGKENPESPVTLRLEMKGTETSNSVWLQFSEAGAFDTTVKGDAVELQALSAEYSRLAVEKSGGLLNIAHLPLNESFNLPLDVSSTESGEFTLKATDFALPAGMSVVFHDYQTGFEQEITEDFEYKFELGSEVAAKAVNPGNLVAGPLMAKSSGSDRFGIAIQPTGTSTENTDTPAEFALEQNYPNPFNPSTTIQYSVAEPGQVSLSVYNLMGQRVAELVNETKSAGTFNVSWNASNAASGMYYYRLVAGGKTITRKMTLIK